MLRNWTQRVFALLQLHGSNARRARRGDRRRFAGARRGAMIQHLESLESRRLLTSPLIAVNVSGGAVTLTDVSARKASGSDFDVAYTGTQFVLTGHNGTMFQVGNQTLSTDTISVSGTLSLSMSLGGSKHGSAVSVSGDGTANLSSFVVDLGNGREGNSLTMTKVVADTATINGGVRDDLVVMTNCTINKDLNATLGRQSGDTLDLETTTVKGSTTNQSTQLVMNHSTLLGKFSNSQPRRYSSFQSTDTTYTGAVDIEMGRHGTINLLSSTDGANHFKSTESVTGRRHAPTVINVETGAVINDTPPTLTNATINGSTTPPAATITAPTVNTLFAATSNPTITGTFDSTNGPNLSVTANGKTYKLGTDAQLTSPSTGHWSLNLTGEPALTAFSNTVTATSSNNSGDSKSGTGTVTNEQAAISAFLTANSLTSTKTASGLNIVTTSEGSGAIPTAGQSVSVNYTGRFLNSDGTLGSVFDSNVDPQHPFTFTLGQGSVIPGWDEAFALLKVGTVAKLLIPSELAYDNRAQPGIPLHSMLEFDVTLISAS